MKKILLRIIALCICVATLTLVACNNGSNMTDTDGTGESSEISSDTETDQEENPETMTSMSDVTIRGKKLSEFMVVADKASNSAGTTLKKAIQEGMGIRIIPFISIEDIDSYAGIPYIYIATLPINGESYDLDDDEAIFFEDNGNFRIVLGSRKVAESTAVNYFLNTVLTSSKTLDGYSKTAKLTEEANLSPLIKQAESKATTILNASNTYTAANVTGHGTCYYVSYSQGNDNNDGLTPETAWKTIDKVNSITFSPGSVVLFKRGDIWRIDSFAKGNKAGYLILKSDVIYSSYGTGEKPAIYGSPWNAAEKGTWTQTDVANVWKYSEALNPSMFGAGSTLADENFDIGNLIFNEGEAYGYKKATNFTDDLQKLNGISGLKNNFEFWYNTSDDHIYLYYDGGNPGDKFESIELATRLNLVRISTASNVVFDNFTLKYGGAHGVAIAVASNVKVTNCEIGWMGGGVYDNTASSLVRYGNGVEINRDVDNAVIDNNYIYQIYDAGVTHQYDSRNNPDSTTTCYHKNLDYINNVFEYCFYSIEYFEDPSEKYPNLSRYMENIEISGNYFLYSGYGWGYWRHASGQPAATHIKGWHQADSSIVDGTITVENNYFLISKFDMIYATCDSAADISNYNNNVFVQYEGNKTIVVDTKEIEVAKRGIWDTAALTQNQYLKNKGNRYYTVK